MASMPLSSLTGRSTGLAGFSMIATGKNYLTAIIKGKTVFLAKLPYYADFPAMDSKGNIWVATRANDLFVFKTHPDDPSNYLEQKLFFKKDLAKM